MYILEFQEHEMIWILRPLSFTTSAQRFPLSDHVCAFLPVSPTCAQTYDARHSAVSSSTLLHVLNYGNSSIPLSQFPLKKKTRVGPLFTDVP